MNEGRNKTTERKRVGTRITWAIIAAAIGTGAVAEFGEPVGRKVIDGISDMGQQLTNEFTPKIDRNSN